MKMVEVHPGHMLVLIQALFNEVNDHLQDEQGDWDRSDVDAVYNKIYALLGTTPDEQPHREPTMVGEDKVYLSIDGINRKDGRIYAMHTDFRTPEKGIKQTWRVYNEETYEWDETK